MTLSDSEQVKLKDYIGRRGQSKAAITRIEKFYSELTATHTLEDVNIRLEALERAYLDFIEHDNQIMLLNQPSELEIIESRYFSIKAKLRTAATKRNTIFNDLHQQFHNSMLAFADQQRGYLETLSTSFTTNNNDHSEVRLPKLHIPQFSGDYAEFPAFRDLYESSVHNRESLANVQKFQYLKGLLKGEAAMSIRHLTVTDANYDGAWATIIERYDKKRCVISKLLNTFFSIQPIHNRNNLRQGLYNIAGEVLRGLAALGPEADKRDPWLIHWLLEKADKETKLSWAKSSSDKDFPTIDDFMKLLGKECDEVEMLAGTQSSSISTKPKPFIGNRSTQVNVTSIEVPACICCEESHHLATCNKFKTMDLQVRKDFVQNNRVCYNCLSRKHRVTSCPSRFSCRLCKRRHHTLLHDNTSSGYDTTRGQPPSNSTSSTTGLTVNSAQLETIPTELEPDAITINLATNLESFAAILPTALVMVKNNVGEFVRCRILLDSGSQASFISESCIQRLGLKRSNARVTVSGIATDNQQTRGITSVPIKSRFDSSKIFEMNVFVLRKLTTISQPSTFNVKNFDYLKNLQLADPHYEQLNEIDILLGANKVFEVFENGKLKGLNGDPVAQNTAFGWVLSGEYKNQSSNIQNMNIILNEESIDHTLRRFFECEEMDCSSHMTTNEEELAEQHFKANMSRDNDGRYIVALPFKPNHTLLGQSLFQATKRFQSVERRMLKDPHYKELYVEFMETYKQLGHMTKIEAVEVSTNHQHYYLPHHAVLKNSSSTTKLRTVFDGSSKTSNGQSLNDNLMIGPTIQPTLWSILMRFRGHPIALCADVEKMYRQVRVQPKDTEFQRIVWRHSPELPIEHYRLNTVTYGTSAAPFLAIRSLIQLANDMEQHFPQAAHIIRNDFYVDDLLSGALNINDAINLKRDLVNLLKSGGFPLRKWISNIPELCDTADPITFNQYDPVVKVLGLAWDPRMDTFKVKIDSNMQSKYSKRSLLSESSKVFDPMGWLAPSIIMIKILFQKLWLLKLDWDSELPKNIEEQWIHLRDNLKHFKKLNIPRFIPCNTECIQLHGFCDASESAYAAVVYCRFLDEYGNVKSKLLASKTKVAPLKQITLPRLELCTAVLLTRLMIKVKRELQPNIKEFCWTDSTIVLSWLTAEPRRWKTYVANRTSEIISTLPRSKWRHVKSAENPADCATRGLLPETLVKFDLWWVGPTWLTQPESTWKATPYTVTTNSETICKEERRKWVQCLQMEESNGTIDILFEQISSWRKIKRVLAVCIRFFNNTREKQRTNRTYGTLTINELQAGERVCLLWCQQKSYGEEIANLKKSICGKLSSLAPFIDGQGILRVGGRLQNTTCTYDTKHPIILPKSHILSKMIATYYHLKYLHPGPSLLSSLLKQKFWIVNGRSMIREITHKCQVCVRQRAITSKQLMGTLPTSRVTVSRPFSRVGVDYCGPISIATKKGRGAKYIKAYISVFVCMVTKAMHLEVVSDLTSDAFLAALKRFIARRGLPAEINSDNGTNFIGANRKINQFSSDIGKINNTSIISDFLHENGTIWKFIPPASPNFAGIWEAAVKSVKAHLIRVTGNSNLTFEEMTTLTCQIEAILNSRPLCQNKSDDPSNVDILTPGHFLIMAPLTSLPEPNLESVSTNRLTRWEQVNKRMNSFWRQYSRDYLHTLQQRNKWQTPQPNLQRDDIVLVKDDRLPPCQWLKAKIVDIHPGDDGLVRVVTLRTANSTYKRPVSKIVQLPIN